MKRRVITKEDIQKAVEAHPQMYLAAASLNLPMTTFRSHAIKHGLYNSNPRHKGVTRYDLDMTLAKTRRVNGYILKERLFAAGFKKNECEECGQGPVWNSKVLVLQIDHVDGNPTNNSLENLKIVCPNCHTQTHTYAGKNKK